MRRDIEKVIFERAKGGRTWAKKTPRASQVLLDSSGEQFNENSNHIRLKRQKSRNPHYNAVEHCLVRNVGRPWSKVYSEICDAVDARSTLGAEIRGWVKCLVAVPERIDGREFVLPCGRPVHGLYICPKSGLLKRTGP